MDPCPFCRIAAGLEDADLVALRTDRVLVVPALRQRRRNRGHALVLPADHVARTADADPALLGEILRTAGRVGLAQRAAFGATGTTTFLNEDAPDQVLPHLHVHVVPRRAGDRFRMPDPEGEVQDREERRLQGLALAAALRSPPSTGSGGRG